MAGNYLSAAQVATVRRLRSAYQNAFQVIGPDWAPWETLAAIHYREAAFAERSKVPGGPFQLDPGGTGDELKRRIAAEVARIGGLYKLTLGDIETDFETAAIVAAHGLKERLRVKAVRSDGTLDESIIAWAFFRYNGLGAMIEDPATLEKYRYYSEKGQTGRGSLATDPLWSPYVSNDPLAGRVLKMRATMPDAKDPTKRVIIHRDDPRPGAMIVFRELRTRAAELA
jgi:hypothetical protein